MATTTTDEPSQRTTYSIGTRKSKLALLQTDLVLTSLKATLPNYEFKILTRDAAGDLNKITPLREFSTKNLWTEELEELLIAKQIDIIVHSLKGELDIFFLYFLKNKKGALIKECV